MHSNSIPESTVIGNYRIERHLGSGGMADVYLATHLLLNKQYAIKVMKPSIGKNDPVMTKRFLREAQIAQLIDHPNIVKVHDVGKDANTGFLYIGMEYLQGINLANYSRAKRVSSKELRSIAHEMAKALDGLHQLGIVHRDIKPSNIMLCQDGSLKLMDLGIAKETQNAGMGQETLTVDQAVLGTPAYSSPEQCRNAKEADIRSDIYCLGATLYAIAAGQPPYDGTSPLDIILKVLEQKPRPLAELRPDLDSDLVLLIEDMMEKSPYKRPQSPGEIIARISSRKAAAKKKLLISTGAIVASLVVVLLFAGLLRTILRGPRKTPVETVSQEASPVEEKTQEHPKPTRTTRPAPGDKPSANSPSEDTVDQQSASKSPEAPEVQEATTEAATAEGTVATETATALPAAAPSEPSAPSPASHPKHVTLQERLADVEDKLKQADFQSPYTDQEIDGKIKELALQESYLTENFDEFRNLVHQVQRYRLQEQIKRYENAQQLASATFNSSMTKRFTELVSKYNGSGHSLKDAEYSAKLLEYLKKESINPNAMAIDSTSMEKEAVPLLSFFLKRSFPNAAELVEALLKKGANANRFMEERKRDPYFSPKPYLQVLTQGGIDRLESFLLPVLQGYKDDIMNLADTTALQTTPLRSSQPQRARPTSTQKSYGVFTAGEKEGIADLILLNHDVHAVDIPQNTALHYAATYGLLDITALLLASGADINARNADGETPLFGAYKYNHPAICKLLLDLGADADVKNYEGKQPESYLEHGAFINSVLEKDLVNLKSHLEKGYSPDTIIPVYKCTLLEYSYGKWSTDMMELLLQYHADTELFSYYPRPLLWLLSSSAIRPMGRTVNAFFSLLLKYGANPNTSHYIRRDFYLLDHILQQKDSYRDFYSSKLPRRPGEVTTADYVKELLVLGNAQFGATSSYALLFTPDNEDILSVYLQYSKDFKDDVPLLPIAVSAGVPNDILVKLIDKKANVNCPVSGNLQRLLSRVYLASFPPNPPNDSRTALYIAVEQCRLDTVNLLLKHGARKYYTTQSGKSILQLRTTPEIRRLITGMAP